MTRIALILAPLALLGVGLWQGVIAIRKDAVSDILRELQIQQVERDTADATEREERIQEIEDATPDELWQRACDGGMFDADTCP